VKRLVTIVVLGLAFLIGGRVEGKAGRTYTTNFSATENPISEGGYWRNRARDGLDWKDIRTASGLAFGTQDGSQSTYNDSTAVLTGALGPRSKRSGN
jgi:hypothetical protein